MAKKLLIIGPDYFGYNESVAKSFQKFGWTAKIINYYEVCPPGIINTILCRYLSKLGIKYFANQYKINLNQEITNIFNEFSPDMVIIIKGNNVFRETIKNMGNSIKVLWMMDSIFRVPESLNNVDLYDYSFMFEESDVERLKSMGIESTFLPMAVDTNNYYPIPNERDIDLLFVGRLYDSRVQLFTELINLQKDRNIQIYGNYLHWKKPMRFINYYFKGFNKYFKNRFVQPDELNKLYSRSKIALSIHHNQSQHGCNPRTFEILATKTFQLVDENPFIKEHFAKHGYLVTYKNDEDLFRKIQYYLDENPNEREEIAERGYHYVTKSHTFDNRVKKILDVIYN